MTTFNKSEIQTIVIFRSGELSQMLRSVPALHALRKEFAHAYIALVGLAREKEFAKRFTHLIDDFIEFPGFPGIKKHKVDPELVLQFLQKVQSRKFDLAIQMQVENPRTNRLVKLFRAKYSAGFYPDREDQTIIHSKPEITKYFSNQLQLHQRGMSFMR